MDRVVKARFFQAENLQIGQATLFDCLGRLWEHQNRDEYEEISDGVRVRLERLSEGLDEHGLIEGEFVRQQDENIPPRAADGAPLVGSDDPIGHRCAFAYHPQANALLLESKREAVTPTRIGRLIKKRVINHRGFLFSPILSSDALEKLQNGTPRKFRMRVARPNDVAHLENDALNIEDNLERFQQMLGGPNVEVSVSFPNTDRESVLSANGLRRIIGWATNHRANVEHLSVKILEESDPIDVFSEQIKVESVLDLDSRNVELHYGERRRFLYQQFHEFLPTIQRLYGAAQ